MRTSFVPNARTTASGASAASAASSCGPTQLRSSVGRVTVAPPIYPPEPEHASALTALNAAVGRAFPADRVIDFASAMTRGDFEADGLHPNAAGQHKRARAALRALAGGH